MGISRLEYQRNYCKTHKERIKFLSDRYRKTHREYINSLQRKGHAKNKEHRNFLRRKRYKETGGAWHKQYSIKYKERISKNNKIRYEKNREKKGIKKRCIWWLPKEVKKLIWCINRKIPNPYIAKKYLKNKTLSSIQSKERLLGLHNPVRTKEFKLRFAKFRASLNGKTWEEMYGYEKAREMKEKKRIRMTGEGNISYKDGKGREPYPMEFNNFLRQKIRKRDKCCKICHCSRNQIIKKTRRDLSVHHINRNKKDNNEMNLISLCIYHHQKIQFIEEDLQDHFHAIIQKEI